MLGDVFGVLLRRDQRQIRTQCGKRFGVVRIYYRHSERGRHCVDGARESRVGDVPTAKQNYWLATESRETERGRRMADDEDTCRDRVRGTAANYLTPADEFRAKRLAPRMRRNDNRVSGCRLDSVEDSAKCLEVLCRFRGRASGGVEVGVAGESVINEYARRRDYWRAALRTKQAVVIK